MTQTKCLNCGAIIEILKNKEQKYCSDKKCQNIRKNLWRKLKLKFDSDYLENKKISNKKWQEKNKGYWKQYREKNKAYALKNKQTQQMRRVKKVAKRDALSDLISSNTNSYKITLIDNDVAKRDGLLVEITLNTNGYARQSI